LEHRRGWIRIRKFDAGILARFSRVGEAASAHGADGGAALRTPTGASAAGFLKIPGGLPHSRQLIRRGEVRGLKPIAAVALALGPNRESSEMDEEACSIDTTANEGRVPPGSSAQTDLENASSDLNRQGEHAQGVHADRPRSVPAGA
jgi:hypothetical protein